MFLALMGKPVLADLDSLGETGGRGCQRAGDISGRWWDVFGMGDCTLANS